uniref:Cyclin n=2 Tax=Chloropicon primus TaxID=1764295 RepID=A0A7S2T3W5_9CHLO|mmetsp:Transcript_3949/g.11464  ORF Transcript_3949/g.11464 Transcript_3949/m.11464 type:complete len:430 (+) Transcript_3949:452-1741(+)
MTSEPPAAAVRKRKRSTILQEQKEAIATTTTTTKGLLAPPSLGVGVSNSSSRVTRSKAKTQNLIMVGAEATTSSDFAVLELKNKGSVNSSASCVSTTTKASVECLLRCNESPLASHSEDGLAAITKIQSPENGREPQHRHSKRVVAPIVVSPSCSASQKKKLVSPSCVKELAGSFRFLSQKDEETRPSADYLKNHDVARLPTEYINSNMRTICCGWMVELSLEFKFEQETLLLAIRIFDRFLTLSPEPVSRKVLQLVAISSMLIASKMEEVVHPSVKDFSRMSADTFSAKEVKRMEVSILQILDYRIHSPSMGGYVNIINEATGMSQRNYFMASYLVELCSMNYGFLRYPPCLVASSAVYVSRKRTWTKGLEALTGYKERQLLDCASFVEKVHQQACEESEPDAPLMPLKEKYRMHSKMCVSHEKPFRH